MVFLALAGGRDFGAGFSWGGVWKGAYIRRFSTSRAKVGSKVWCGEGGGKEGQGEGRKEKGGKRAIGKKINKVTKETIYLFYERIFAAICAMKPIVTFLFCSGDYVRTNRYSIFYIN